MKTTLMPAVLALALACNGKTDTTPTPPTGDTGTVTVPTTTTFSGFPDADLADEETIRDLAWLSAEQMQLWVFLTATAAFNNSDPACPVVDEADPANTNVTGGCTDYNGVAWTGSIHSVVDVVTGEQTLTFTDWGYVDLEASCYALTVLRSQNLNGTLSVDNVSGQIELDLAGLDTAVDPLTCATADRNFVLQYGMTISDLTAGAQYDSSGRYADDQSGYVEVQTIGEIEADAGCSSEAESGGTFFSTAAHEAVITYDGALDCDDPPTSSWTLDGVAQGELLGIGCSSTPGAAGWLALAPLAALIRRRAR